MFLTIRDSAGSLFRFLRTPTLGRAVVALMAMALVLMAAVNLATFVMIRRTAEFNNQIEHIQTVRLTARDVQNHLISAETGQRGFMLTGRAQYLTIHNNALAALPPAFERLDALTVNDPEIAVRIDRVRDLSQKSAEVMGRTVDLAQSGRIGEAVQLLRQGEGKVLMDAMRSEIAMIDEIEAARVVQRTNQSEWASTLTVIVNALAMLLILVLGGVCFWLVRRYVAEILKARFELDRLNAGLENEVRDRTAELLRANEEIQRFAYIVSHDLRSPLVNVMGYTAELEAAGRTFEAQLARIEADAPDMVMAEARLAVQEDVPEAVGFIRTSTAKMDRLINAILQLSREGRRVVTPETLDMTALCLGIADTVRHRADGLGAAVEVRPLPAFESDRFSIEQIFGNLIDNAVKYLDPERAGRIVVDGAEDGDRHVVFTIADNGRGVAERDHERIFELFRRSGRQDQPGEGLGLAFVRNSVRRLGGEITLESDLGRGSTFRLRFPRRLAAPSGGDVL